MGKIFETNAKMVLINDDQCDIADIVLDVWLFKKKLITLVEPVSDGLCNGSLKLSMKTGAFKQP